MKVFIAVCLCKILYFVGSRIGKGSSLPGLIALKVCPGVLKQLKLPKTIIAITGSNGKTTTAEFVTHALKQSGKTVGWNHEGSNQTEGVATLLLRLSSLSGKVNRDALVIECDERYAAAIFKQVKPTALVVTNLCRDQLTRNGHFEFISDCLRAAVAVAGNNTKLILNADDPYVSSLCVEEIFPWRNSNEAKMKTDNVIWFGVNSNDKASCAITPYETYDDGKYCPVCKSAMEYTGRVAGHYGNYNCKSCGFIRHVPNTEISALDLQTGEVTVEPSKAKLTLATPGLVGAYNIAATIAAVSTVNVNQNQAAKILDKYALKGGRTLNISVADRKGMLLIAKHENSFAYNQAISYVIATSNPCTVVIMVNSISRKYYTSETSWLWDIAFDALSKDSVKNVVLCGKYVNELASRFALSAVSQEKIGCIEDLTKLANFLKTDTFGEIYAITCFSDKAVLMESLRGTK